MDRSRPRPPAKPRPPARLGAVGRALWDDHLDEAVQANTVDELRAFCREADAGAPDDLGPAGAAVWASIAAKYDDLGPRELTLLAAACHQADAVTALEADIDREGRYTIGAAGQTRLSAAVAEARQGRLALGRLLDQLHLPDAADKPMSVASRRAQRAAQARWGHPTGPGSVTPLRGTSGTPS